MVSSFIKLSLGSMISGLHMILQTLEFFSIVPRVNDREVSLGT